MFVDYTGSSKTNINGGFDTCKDPCRRGCRDGGAKIHKSKKVLRRPRIDLLTSWEHHHGTWLGTTGNDEHRDLDDVTDDDERSFPFLPCIPAAGTQNETSTRLFLISALDNMDNKLVFVDDAR
ncbi:hypothetical protein CC2G_005290 [Coprinopsis cinerea AmutBmut pab1-1]|nr:hypothetical protein CC2G_005290 [Coprinopsis cinerea AmutBmut pab1-1]